LPIERVRRLRIDVPPNLQRHMAEWGPKLRREMAVQAGDGFSRALSTADFSVGTDCSGLEAPVLALQAMNIPHKHVFSCDVSTSAQIGPYYPTIFVTVIIGRCRLATYMSAVASPRVAQKPALASWPAGQNSSRCSTHCGRVCRR
jgi:hypothetical protein